MGNETHNPEESPSSVTITAPDDAPVAARSSAVDTFFDAVTSRTARGLVVAQSALERAARWLDARAKIVGELATKLSTTPPAS